MASKISELTDDSGFIESNLYDYLLSVSLREPQVLTQLREETAQLPDGEMQIAPDQGQFMALLIKLMGVKRILEIGTFTGYSSLWMALALPSDGLILTCDISKEDTAIAQRYWQAAGMENKVDLHLAPALDTLNDLLNTGAAGTFDFVFIDADKVNYHHYYEKSLQLLRPGGLMAIDNVLWSGEVADPTADDPDTNALKALNLDLCQDDRIELSMLGIADGLTLALKKS